MLSGECVETHGRGGVEPEIPAFAGMTVSVERAGTWGLNGNRDGSDYRSPPPRRPGA